MTSISKFSVVAALVLSSAAHAQPPTLSVEERVTALEKQLASIATRFATREALGSDAGAGRAASIEGRVTALERALERLASDLQRVERRVDSAARDASQARRDAMAAQQMARDAAMRAR